MKGNQAKPNPVRAFVNTPKGYVLVALLLITAVACVFDRETRVNGLINMVAAVGAAVLLDVAFALEQERKRIFPDGAVLTGLIVAVVLSTSVPWYLCAATAAVAILSKHLLKVKRKPIFNPAAFGLAVAILLFHSGQSWWGGLALLPAWCVALVIAAGMLVTHRVNKFPLVFAFLGAYFGLLLLGGLVHIGDVGDALRMPFSNAVLFLAFFMVTDPPTTPAKEREQVIFGILAAVISVVDLAALNGLSFLLLGLLAANGWHAWRSTNLSDSAGLFKLRV